MKGKPKTKLFEWQKKLKDKEAKCSRCGRNYYLTVDHIVPQNLLLQLNLVDEIYNWEENFEIVCGACNKFKGGMLDLANPKTIPLLEEALKRAKLQIEEYNQISRKIENGKWVYFYEKRTRPKLK